MWRHGRGYNYLSARYKQWKITASKELLEQKVSKVYGSVQIRIILCYKGFWDLDNRVKPLLDLLASNGIIEGDDRKTVKRIITEEGNGFSGARVTVEPWSEKWTGGDHGTEPQ